MLPHHRLVPRTVAVLGALVTFSLVGMLSATAATSGDFSYVGHRGYPQSRFTENTIASFQNAYDHGAPAVETDVRLTSDKQFLLMHDQTLRRTTNCRHVHVANRRIGWIQDHCHGRRRREALPDLTDLLRWGRDRAMNLVVEIKTDPLDRWRTADFARIDTLVKRFHMSDRVHLLSFSAPLLQLAERADPSFVTDWIVTRPQLLDDASKVDALASWVDSVSVSSSALTSERVDALQALGLSVYGRDTDLASDWALLRDVGADGLLTDRVSAYGSWLQSAPPPVDP